MTRTAIGSPDGDAEMSTAHATAHATARATARATAASPGLATRGSLRARRRVAPPGRTLRAVCRVWLLVAGAAFAAAGETAAQGYRDVGGIERAGTGSGADGESTSRTHERPYQPIHSHENGHRHDDDGKRWQEAERLFDKLESMPIRCNGEIIGGVLGGVLGGAIGARAGDDHPVAGAAAGAALGALLGRLIGADIDEQDPRCGRRAPGPIVPPGGRVI